LGLVVLSALPARAADANAAPGAGQIAVGYSYLYISDKSIPAGWFFSAGANITDAIAVVGDISGNYKSDSETTAGGTLTFSTNVYTFLAGPRVTARSGQLNFYGQFLVGAARGAGSITLTGGGASFASSGSDTEFCLAPGAGVDFNLGDRAALRAGVSERLIRVNTSTSTTPGQSTFEKEFQLQIGLVYRFGN
jgi:opacity protein-like surface antigen